MSFLNLLLTALLCLLLGVTCYLLFRFLLKRMRYSHDETESDLQFAEINKRTIEEAKHLAELVLNDPKKFTTVRSDITDKDQLQALSPCLKEFFSRYESIAAVRGDLKLDRKEIQPSLLVQGCLKIGSDSADTELVVRDREETILQVDGFESKTENYIKYSTVYHLILVVNHDIYGET